MRKNPFRFILYIFMIACNQTTNNTDPSATGSFAALLDTYWEERMELFPLEATGYGDNRYNDKLYADFTDAYREKLKIFYQKNLDALRGIDPASLDNNDRNSYEIFKHEMETSIEGLQFQDYYTPTNQFWGVHLTMGQMGSGEGSQPFKTVKDYDNWIQRATAFTQWADSAIAYFRKGVEAGYVLPRSLVIKIIPQMHDLVVTDATKSLFYGPITKMPNDFSAADKDRLTKAYVILISDKLTPAYKKLGDFLQKEYLPHARSSSGIDSAPGGSTYYAYLVRYWTTTNKTPDEIYNTGLAEVARIHGIMDSVKNAVGFTGDTKAFFDYMKTDKRFYPYKNPEEILDAFRSIQAMIEPHLKDMFAHFPKSKFEIRQTEAFRAASASAEYQPGTPDGSRPGIFYVPIVDAAKFNITSGMESLFLHEAIPGHHYQGSLQMEDTTLPVFRRFLWYGAYGEGWALYCESLGKELGLYTDPYQYMGALGDEMHRAIRLVVDVAIHTKNMSRETAIRYMMDNEATSEEGATAEIERYMAAPAQALSYKIGALKIRELRSKYEKQLGSKFNLAAFHDECLKDGCMPLDLLERKMDVWAAKR